MTKVILEHSEGSTCVEIIYAVSHVTFYCFILCPMSSFIRFLLRHITFYNICMYVFIL